MEQLFELSKRTKVYIDEIPELDKYPDLPFLPYYHPLFLSINPHNKQNLINKYTCLTENSEIVNYKGFKNVYRYIDNEFKNTNYVELLKYYDINFDDGYFIKLALLKNITYNNFITYYNDFISVRVYQTMLNNIITNDLYIKTFLNTLCEFHTIGKDTDYLLNIFNKNHEYLTNKAIQDVKKIKVTRNNKDFYTDIKSFGDYDIIDKYNRTIKFMNLNILTFINPHELKYIKEYYQKDILDIFGITQLKRVKDKSIWDIIGLNKYNCVWLTLFLKDIYIGGAWLYHKNTNLIGIAGIHTSTIAKILQINIINDLILRYTKEYMLINNKNILLIRDNDTHLKDFKSFIVRPYWETQILSDEEKLYNEFTDIFEDSKISYININDFL